MRLPLHMKFKCLNSKNLFWALNFEVKSCLQCLAFEYYINPLKQVGEAFLLPWWKFCHTLENKQRLLSGSLAERKHTFDKRQIPLFFTDRKLIINNSLSLVFCFGDAKRFERHNSWPIATVCCFKVDWWVTTSNFFKRSFSLKTIGFFIDLLLIVEVLVSVFFRPKES